MEAEVHHLRSKTSKRCKPIQRKAGRQRNLREGGVQKDPRSHHQTLGQNKSLQIPGAQTQSLLVHSQNSGLR